uniref:Uncharacterized protein n=1 Tax=Kryptolebias marmoratus TaxID=37003 RepID=A0A3Q2ZC72_KRYMA
MSEAEYIYIYIYIYIFVCLCEYCDLFKIHQEKSILICLYKYIKYIGMHIYKYTAHICSTPTLKLPS